MQTETMKNLVLKAFTLIMAIMMLVACDKKSNENNPGVVNTSDELTAVLQEVYEGAEAPGFSVSIVKDNAIYYQNTYLAACTASLNSRSHSSILEHLLLDFWFACSQIYLNTLQNNGNEYLF